MAVAKRQGREKPTKIEQRKVWGLEWGPQVEQTALLASPVYIGQVQGEEEKTYKNRSQRAGALSLPCSLFSSYPLGRHALMPRGCIFLYFLNKTELSHGAVTLVCPSAVTLARRFKFLSWWDRTKEITHSPDSSNVGLL